ncbi:polysaccharide deacetylase family protein [Oscillatoria salina]|uniref:polysaccharide deacetylase family protein n=1 Tax=Oscillatoria salina TaxID=331517 RepID=UPI001CC9F067|nr:polysaccharide deacetylase family protein [Oscillatoria salina]
MVQRNSLIWQRRTLIATAAAASSFFAGLFVPLGAGFELTSSFDFLLNFDTNSLELSSLDDRVLVAQSEEIFARLFPFLETLEKEEKAALLKLSVPTSFQGKTINSIPLNNQQKLIALTFDDGPWPDSTNNILYILKQYNIKATFFLLGQNVQNFPALAQQIANHGHALGNHTWNHPYHYHDEAAAAQQIDNTAALIYKTTGIHTYLFRPPGGFLNNGLSAYANKKNHATVMWSADSKDYQASPSLLARNVLDQASPGGIILLHDGGGPRDNTVIALPHIITQLQKQGYQFVTVPQLMELKEQELGVPH